MELVIGDKAWSSWSLRPWLALKHTGAAFTETVVHLRRDDTAAAINAAGSPNGRIPTLKDGATVIWDSLAICEYLADRFPDAALWPADPAVRALARCAAAEMHSGFASLRGECPMDLALHERRDVSELTQADIHRVVALWSDLRGRFAEHGPWLCGAWSIADAFFAPVATRFRSYGVQLSDYGDMGAAGTYAATLLADEHFLEWERAALATAAPSS